MTRRTVLGGLATAALTQVTTQVTAQSPPQPPRRQVEWKPKLGILGPFTEANVRFAKEEGFTNMILGATRKSTMDATVVSDAQLEAAKQTLAKYQMNVSAFQASHQHIDPDPAKRKVDTDYFVKLIENAGKMGIPYIGTSTGKDASLTLEKQVDEIVKVYTERYFPACQANKVRILWEPYPGGANVAISPQGFDALFKAFNNSPYVGLQYDPSHMVWQFMDPIQVARDYVDQIYDVHLKDTEIRWDVLRKVGINPAGRAEWHLYRLPGLGSINWAEFFTVLQRAGYQGAMSLEHEDPLYGSPNRPGPDFSPDYAKGFTMAHRYLRQYVPD